MAKRYPKEVKEFIAANCKGIGVAELAALTNEKMGTDFTRERMKSYLSNHKLKTDAPKGRKIPYTDTFPKECVDYIRANYVGVGPKEMAERLNEMFGKSYSRQQLKSYYKNHKLNSGLDGRFKPGHISEHRFVPGGELPPGGIKYRFAPGHRPKNYKKVGTERVTTDGYIEVKVADPNVWKPKARVVWEAANGPIPEDHVAIFLDRNKRNFSLDNIGIISKKEHLQMNRNRLYYEDRELTKTGMIIAKIKTVQADKTGKGKWRTVKKEDVLKYDEELYLNSEIYGCYEEGVRNHQTKIVKVRVPHICPCCCKEIEKGNFALYETGYAEGGPVSCHTCLKCVEEWLEESGQVEGVENDEE